MRIYTLLATLVLSMTVSAQSLVKPKYQPVTSNASQQVVVNKIQSFSYLLAAFYEKQSENVANYYMIFSSVAGQYDAVSGALTVPKGMALFLDLYAEPTGGKGLPEGTYEAGDGTTPLSYNKEYTYIQVMDADSKVTETIPLTQPITVSTSAGGQSIIQTKATIKGVEKTVRFMGSISFSNADQSADAYYQMTSDINTTFTGGIALYYGNLYESNTGNMVIRLYDCDFDKESGAQLSSGTAVELMLFNVLFANPKDAEVAPGHYTVARNFQRNTWFPGMTINYMGVNIAFGTFAQVLNMEDSSFGDQGYAWSHAASGTIDIEDAGEGKIRITLDLKSKTGYAIKGTYTGPALPVADYSKPDNHAVISTLQEDLMLDLGYVKYAEVYNHGMQEGNTRSFVIDLGTDNDVDKEDRYVLNHTDNSEYGADCMRMEFLTDPTAPYIPEGVYFVMEENYTNYFQAGRMRQGYFANGGEITGTRWMHLAPKRYYVMDGHAPAVSGSVSVQRAGKDEAGKDLYTFNINLVDDAGFNIVGDWTGLVRLHYNPLEINPNAEGIHFNNNNNDNDNRVYDLLGRSLVRQPEHGIYLQRNHKYIIK
ncbi:MAG: hypothetical protein MJZ40_01125 [Bacteroidaceae bacterium]|nr:hypothetical protein [Bacteroidaceae bacterium]